MFLPDLSACGHTRRLRRQTKNNRNGAYLLSITNAEPGSTFELGVYVIAHGDSLVKIARQFHVSVRDIKAMNPDMDPTRLVIGQRVKVYELRRE